ncbi:hypothetical protein VNO78_13288 [Psophocarpus tetragonolobus]|uniref:Uncharacterized protein n=1 Tax=Psophocarpus tetragonolobus TaxID=3891 RepID=A0AAN9XQD4_PSOTE
MDIYDKIVIIFVICLIVGTHNMIALRLSSPDFLHYEIVTRFACLSCESESYLVGLFHLCLPALYLPFSWESMENRPYNASNLPSLPINKCGSWNFSWLKWFVFQLSGTIWLVHELLDSKNIVHCDMRVLWCCLHKSRYWRTLKTKTKRKLGLAAGKEDHAIASVLLLLSLPQDVKFIFKFSCLIELCLVEMRLESSRMLDRTASCFGESISSRVPVGNQWEHLRC